MNELIEYVPIQDAEKYRKRGWTITPMMGNHGHYSVIASKPLTGVVWIGYQARRIWNKWRGA